MSKKSFFQKASALLVVACTMISFAAGATPQRQAIRITNVSNAYNDHVHDVNLPDGFSILLNSFKNQQMYFLANADARFTEYSDKTAELTGTFTTRSLDGTTEQWYAQLNYFNGSKMNSGMTNHELNPGTYYNATTNPTGPVREEFWNFYTLSPNSKLTGISSTRTVNGAVILGNKGQTITLTQRTDMGAFQLGFGANGKNIDFGGSGWINWVLTGSSETQTQGPGDVNVNLPPFYCVDEPSTNSGCGGQTSLGALSIQGVGSDFIFKQKGALIQYPNGTALLKGSVESKYNDNKRFNLTLFLSGQVLSSSNPIKELIPQSIYGTGVNQIDTNSWYYYTDFIGSLEATDGTYKGYKLALTPNKAFVQIGKGANGKNTSFGASAWFNYFVQVRPGNSNSIPESGIGAANVDLEFCLNPNCCPSSNSGGCN